MSACNSLSLLQTINLEESVGKSLNTINNNFSLINEQTCKQYDEVNQLLSYSTQTDDLVSQLERDFFGYCKCFVIFENSGNIIQNKNVSYIEKNSTGNFTIYFNTPIQDSYVPFLNTMSSQMSFANIYYENIHFLKISCKTPNNIPIDPDKIFCFIL